MGSVKSLPQTQRVAAYAVILREDRILLSRISPRIANDELWTLPGGGIDHGEDPRDAVVREVFEETGLRVAIGETARVYSAHLPGVWRSGKRVNAHALRIVYDGWVPPDAPEPAVQEVDGSTVEARWVPLTDVRAGRVPVVPMVAEALADHRPFRLQRLAVYAVVRRTDPPSILLTRISPRGHHTGSWTLPGGGVGHGETPADALRRELIEETGLAGKIGDLLDVHDIHFSGTAPSGRWEDYHGVHLLYDATVPTDVPPRVVALGGTTDAAAWIPIADIESGATPVLDVVGHALQLLSQRS